MSVYVSIFAYPIGKTYAEPEAFVKQEIEAGEKAEWPCFRTLARLQALERDIQLSVDTSTLITKARSRAAGIFHRSERAVWVSIDDDVEASTRDLELLLTAARDPLSNIIVAPCCLRGRDVLNIAADKRSIRDNPVRLLECESAGLALAAITHEAIVTLGDAFPRLWWTNSELGQVDSGLGVFLETVEGHHWYGEDFAFCKRARAAHLHIEALCDSEVTHAGRAARISQEWLESPEATTSSGLLKIAKKS